MWEPNENTLGPGNPGAFEYNDSSNFPEVSNGETIGAQHNGAGNALAIDGHVDVLSKIIFNGASKQKGAGPQGRGLLWWAPNVAAGGWVAN
jgi:prepilin-type processing-associated H-X9-DG protein